MNIGLVLSGGMAKGAYQIGALQAIKNFLPTDEIKYISCASIGVLNGYAYATDKLDYAETMWKELCCEDTRLFVNQILKSSLLQQDIKNLYAETDKISSIFYCSLLDMMHNNIVYKNLNSVESSKIPQYLKASVAMPIYNRAVKIDGVSYFDGAMIDNIPVFPLMKHKLDYIICIYFDDTCYKFENTYFDNKIIKITFPGESMLRQSLVFTKERVNNMIKDGYARTNDILNMVFRNGYEDLDYIYQAIERRNMNKTKSLRITGDVLVTNSNKVAQKFAKRKIIL